MTRIAALTLLLALAVPVSAGSKLPSFSDALQAVRSQVMATKAEQIKAKTLASQGEIDNIAFDLRRHDWEAGRLKRQLSDIRRRAQRVTRTQPNQPRRDPMLDSDIRRLVQDLRSFDRKIERSERRTEDLARSAPKDPQLVRPAEALLRNAEGLVRETRWLESEGRWARWDIQRAGYNFEAWDIERYTRDSYRSAENTERAARTLLDKVR